MDGTATEMADRLREMLAELSDKVRELEAEKEELELELLELKRTSNKSETSAAR
jgi:predicted RNase H-like nuclease (RuvC/YqgF family)